MKLKNTTEIMVTAEGIDFDVRYADDGDDFTFFEVSAKFANSKGNEWIEVTHLISEELLEELMQTVWDERDDK